MFLSLPQGVYGIQIEPQLPNEVLNKNKRSKRKKILEIYGLATKILGGTIHDDTTTMEDSPFKNVLYFTTMQ